MSVSPIGAVVDVSGDMMAALLENKPTQNFEESLNGFMRSWDMLNGDLPLDEAMAEEYTEELYTGSLHPVGVAWNHIRCQENLPILPQQLKEVHIPGLFLNGEKDPLIQTQKRSYRIRSLPSITVEVVLKMGHMMFHKELQQQIAERLLRHFAQSEMEVFPICPERRVGAMFCRGLCVHVTILVVSGCRCISSSL
jgi:pimeloyl-ACP methyl ester carboxylesterase